MGADAGCWARNLNIFSGRILYDSVYIMRAGLICILWTTLPQPGVEPPYFPGRAL